MTSLYSLKTVEDVSALRSSFLLRLISEHYENIKTLEINNGKDSVTDHLSDNNIDVVDLNSLEGKYKNKKYKQIIWFNGMNWVRPKHPAAIASIKRCMVKGGRFFCSFASLSYFVNDNPYLERELANDIRTKNNMDPVDFDFNELRFGLEEIRNLLFELKIIRYEHIEADLKLTGDAFRELHLGSINCLFKGTGDLFFKLSEEYNAKLLDLYMSGIYRPRLSTSLVCAEL